jgi:ferredoxin-NADP reductase
MTLEAAPRARLGWQVASVVEVVAETARARSIVLEVPGWPGHLPGQHVDVRLTAEDGYQAQRSYSIASPTDGPRIAITVEQVEDGEVSPYLADVLQVGDGLELRGPIGGYFVWRADDDRPVLLVAGGSGLVPLMAILRARFASGSHVPMRLLLSARSAGEILYAGELAALERDADGVTIARTLTREQPAAWGGYRRRVDQAMLAEVAFPPDQRARTFVCGPTGFVEAVASALVALGHDPEDILTERFGPSGG